MSNKRGNCVVTGGAGFIGCALSAGLAQRFERIVVVDRLHPQIHPKRVRPEALHPSVELVIADVCEAETWNRVLGDVRPHVVIHLAAETGTGQSLTESTRHAEANVIGTTQMLDALVRHSATPERIVFSGSRAVYGEGAWRRRANGEVFYPGQRSSDQLASATWDFGDADPLPHDSLITQPAPTSVYGATKLAQEHILSAWALSFGAKLSILRFQNVYGPGQSLINPYTGIVSLFVRLAKAGQSIPLYEDGLMKRDFVFIDDVSAAVLSVIDDEGGAAGVFDIGNGRATSIGEIASLISKRYGAPDPHVSGQFRNGDVRHASADISGTLSRLNWSPKWTAESGLDALCHWIDKQIA